MSEFVLDLWAALLGAVILPNRWILSPAHGVEVRTETMPQGMPPHRMASSSPSSNRATAGRTIFRALTCIVPPETSNVGIGRSW
jgi:hypothetical protein